jgi:ribosomal protein L37E
MFNLNDTVYVPDRRDYGIIAKIERDKALVRFKIPRQPKTTSVCDRCGSTCLSVTGDKNEIVCASPGCGYKHGLDTREETFSFNLLDNLTEMIRKQAASNFRENLASLLEEGIVSGAVTKESAERILKEI